MKCLNCGKELNENAKFCDQCGISVNEVQTENDNVKVDHAKSKKTLNKKTIIIFGIIAVVIVLLIVAIISIGGGSEDNQNNNNNYVASNNDNFGNNEVVTAAPTEVITAPQVNDIEVVYDDIIYDKTYGEAAVKIIDYSIQYTNNGTGLMVYITFEKVADTSRSYRSFASSIYFYDAAGNIIDTRQALYVPSFKADEIGKQYRDDCWYGGMSIANISAQAIARIEIGD